MITLVNSKTKKAEGAGDSLQEAVWELKRARSNDLVYPDADGKTVHVRVRDKDGEYPTVEVLDVKQDQ